MVIGLDFAEKYGKLRYGIIFNVTKVISCGTKYLGFKRYSCRDCNRNKSVAFSCKGRFCSRCGKKQTDQWVSKASNVLPKTRWQHITFTMPDSLWPIFWLNRDLFGLISGVAAGIIKEIATKKNLVVGIFTALHTFGRDLKRNVHIHLSVTCGGINSKGKWQKLFFPAEPIKKMWRHRVLELTFKFLDHYNNTIDRITMPVMQFIASLIMHIPDRYFRMIRYYGFLSNRTRGVQLPIVYKAINQIVHKKTKLISWRLMIWLNFKIDPLFCYNCNKCMNLRQVYYGLSPPLLLIRINELLSTPR